MNSRVNDAGTAPLDFTVVVSGVHAELEEALKELVQTAIVSFASKFDLRGLDGVTIAGEYERALLDLNRGYETKHELVPSNDYGVGIAMSPRVMRDGVLRNHIVFNAQAILEFMRDKQSQRVINLIAHECAHVEITYLFNTAFPGLLLNRKMDPLDAFRWDVTLACWDEFAACWRSAGMGPTSHDEYEVPFLEALEHARDKANSAITQYRIHCDIPRVVSEACSQYWNLLKYAAYHLGNLEGHGITWQQMPNTAKRVQGHWFHPYFEALEAACRGVAKSYGNWGSQSLFEEIGDISEEIIANNGLRFFRHGDGHVGLDIPLTPETTPTYPYA